MYQRIRYFLKAAETGSFSTAARDMFISSQALTKQIKVLEKELGASLFERSPNGVRLTAFGTLAVAELSDLSREFERVIARLREYAATEKLRINIGIFSGLSRDRIVTPVVAYLLTAFPEFQINLEMLEMTEGEHKLDKGQLDFLLTNIHEEMDTCGYENLSFGACEAKVVVSLTHPWVMKEQLTRQNLEKEAFIKLTANEEKYNLASDSSFYRTIPCSSILPAGNYNTMFMLLRQGSGFAVIPTAFLDMEQLQLKAFDYPGKGIRFQTVLAYKQEPRIKELEKIADGLKEEFDLQKSCF